MGKDSTERVVSAWAPVLLILLGLTVLPLLLVFDRPHGSSVEHVKRSGKLRVLTLNGPTTYYEGADGPVGFEYDLAKAFADSLGVKLELEVAESIASILPRLRRGDAHFAAAGITVTPQREKIIRFSPAYQKIEQQVVYKRGELRPRKAKDLIGRQIVVVAGSSFAERLRELQVEHPELEWRETSDKGPEELLVEVSEELLELTVADSNLISVVRQNYPQLAIAFSIKKDDQLAWAFAPETDNSLIEAVARFLESQEKSGQLAQLMERYYGAYSKFDYVNIATFRRRIAEDLRRYERLFREAASASDFDWRLLAAQAYQESQWDPDAVSHTGVKGFMQLTAATARRVKVEDRTNVRESILGGARYLRELSDRLPERIAEPDRTWLALAAYNIGLGHLEDARVLTQKNGGNPDAWLDVKKHLPLLAKPKWHKKTRHGYARGYEPVAYVNRIRSYYEILKEMNKNPRPEKPLEINVPAI